MKTQTNSNRRNIHLSVRSDDWRLPRTNWQQ